MRRRINVQRVVKEIGLPNKNSLIFKLLAEISDLQRNIPGTDYGLLPLC
jgi:hypothetical protein